jgi:hypothetical protein
MYNGGTLCVSSHFMKPRGKHINVIECGFKCHMNVLTASC